MVEFHKTSDNFMLSRRQERAIFELVNPANRTLANIAKKIGVTERTLYNWLNNPHFQDSLRKEREKLLQEGIANLKATFNTAVLTLGKLISDKDASIRLRSSLALVDFGFKLMEREKEKTSSYDSYYEELRAKLNQVKFITANNLQRMQDEIRSEAKQTTLKDP